MRPRPLLLPAAAAFVLAGCVGGPRVELATVARDVALPAPVAAAVIAGALRLELPFADPVPVAAGVPVQHLAPGHWRVAFTRRGRGPAPLASHRLALLPGRDPARAVRIVCEPIDDAQRTDRWPLDRAWALDVRGDASRASVTGSVPRELAPAVERALLLALEPETPMPGLEEPNLAAWAQHRLLAAAAAADRHGDTTRAHAQRQAAARLGAGAAADAGVQAALAADAERRGHWSRALDHDWQALLASDDPRERHAVAARLAAVAARGEHAEAWRAAARDGLHGADPARGRALLHTARRLADEPSADYRLQSQLHRLADADEAAQASALLAREHAGLDVAAVAFAAELWSHAPVPVARTAATQPAADTVRPVRPARGAWFAPLVGRDALPSSVPASAPAAPPR